MSSADRGVRTERRIVTKVPAALYARLISLKLQTRMSLQALMLEGAKLLIAKYRLERDITQSANEDGGAPSP